MYTYKRQKVSVGSRIRVRYVLHIWHVVCNPTYSLALSVELYGSQIVRYKIMDQQQLHNDNIHVCTHT